MSARSTSEAESLATSSSRASSNEAQPTQLSEEAGHTIHEQDDVALLKQGPSGERYSPGGDSHVSGAAVSDAALVASGGAASRGGDGGVSGAAVSDAALVASGGAASRGGDGGVSGAAVSDASHAVSPGFRPGADTPAASRSDDRAATMDADSKHDADHHGPNAWSGARQNAQPTPGGGGAAVVTAAAEVAAAPVVAVPGAVEGPTNSLQAVDEWEHSTVVQVTEMPPVSARRVQPATAILRGEAKLDPKGRAVLADGSVHVVSLQPHQVRLRAYRQLLEASAGGGKGGGRGVGVALSSRRPRLRQAWGEEGGGGGGPLDGDAGHAGRQGRPKRDVVDMVLYAKSLEMRLAAEEAVPTQAYQLPAENTAHGALADAAAVGEISQSDAHTRIQQGLSPFQQSEWLFGPQGQRQRRTPGTVGGRLHAGQTQWMAKRFEQPWTWHLQRGNQLCAAPLTVLILFLWLLFLVLTITVSGGSQLAAFDVNPLVGGDMAAIEGMSGLHASYIHKRGQWWRLPGCTLMSAGVVDFLLNSAVLMLLGTGLEKRLGSWKYFVLLVTGSSLGVLTSQVLAPLTVSVANSAFTASVTAAACVEFAAHHHLFRYRACCGSGFGILLGLVACFGLIPLPFTNGWVALVAFASGLFLAGCDYVLSSAYLLSPSGRIAAARLHAQHITRQLEAQSKAAADARRAQRRAAKQARRAKQSTGAPLQDILDEDHGVEPDDGAAGTQGGRSSRLSAVAPHDIGDSASSGSSHSSEEGSTNAPLASMPESPSRRVTSAPLVADNSPPGSEHGTALVEPADETAPSEHSSPKEDSMQRAQSVVMEGTESVEATAPAPPVDVPAVSSSQAQLTGAARTRHLMAQQAAAAERARRSATIGHVTMSGGDDVGGDSSDSQASTGSASMIDVIPASQEAPWFGRKLRDNAGVGKQRSIAMRGSIDNTDPVYVLFEGSTVYEATAAKPASRRGDGGRRARPDKARRSRRRHSSDDSASSQDSASSEYGPTGAGRSGVAKGHAAPMQRQLASAWDGRPARSGPCWHQCVDPASETGQSIQAWVDAVASQPYSKGFRELPASLQLAMCVGAVAIPLVFLALAIIAGTVETQNLCRSCRSLICTPLTLADIYPVSPYSCEPFLQDDEYAF